MLLTRCLPGQTQKVYPDVVSEKPSLWRFAWLAALCCLAALSCAAAQPDSAHLLFEKTRQRAEKGEAQAQLELGRLYANGTGVPRSLTQSARWYRKAAEQGLAKAQYELGSALADGRGVRPSLTDAADWYRKAAEQGLPEAQVNLGLCYANGDGIRQSETEAAVWYRKAAEQGFPYAKYELGQCYLEGTGVTKDISEGVRLTREAAEAGSPLAQNQMGACCQKGIGMPIDYVQAYKWYDLAASQDDEHAADIRVSLAKVESMLSKEQVSEAQRLALEFRPGAKSSSEPSAVSEQATPAGLSNTNGPHLPEAPVGILTLKANQEDCEIFVDGKFVGNSPAKLKLTDGAHVVEVKKKGYQSYRRELEIGAGSELSLNVSLDAQ